MADDTNDVVTPEVDAATSAEGTITEEAVSTSDNNDTVSNEQAEPTNAERPSWLPDKFTSPEQMVDSYSALEGKLGNWKQTEEAAEMWKAHQLGQPATNVPNEEPNISSIHTGIEDRVAQIEQFHQQQQQQTWEQGVYEKYPDLGTNPVLEGLMKTSLAEQQRLGYDVFTDSNAVEQAYNRSMSQLQAYKDQLKADQKEQVARAKAQSGVYGSGPAGQPKPQINSLADAWEAAKQNR